MELWWYAVGEQRIGPVGLDELKLQLQKNVVFPESLVWREGLQAWGRLRDTEDLKVLLAALPPPLPVLPATPAEPKLEVGMAHASDEPPSATTVAPDSVPSETCGQSSVLPPEPPLAKRWPRFFARMFDIWTISPLVTIAGVLLLLWRKSSGGIGRSALLWLGFFALPIALLIDAVIYRTFGNTPGKALLGINVLDTEG